MKELLNILILITSIGSILGVSAQSTDLEFTPEIDSLIKVSKKANDADRSEIYAMLMDRLSQINVKKAIEYSNEAIALAERLNDDKLLINAHRTALLTYSQWGQYAVALDHSLIAIEKQEEIEDENLYIEVNNIGDIYLELNDYGKAYESYSKSLNLSKEKGDQEMEAIAMFNIGRVYKIQGNYFKGLQYIVDSKKLSERIGDTEGIAYSYHEMGLISNLLGDDGEALAYLFQAIDICDSLELYQLSTQSRVKVANIYKDQGNYLMALENYHKSLTANKNIKDNKGIAETYLGLGELQILMNSTESASESLYKGLGYAKQLEAKKLEFEFYQQLSKLNEVKGRPVDALMFYKKFKSISDSVFDKDVSIQLAVLETQFETAKKDKEIAQLNESKISQEVILEKQETQKAFLWGGISLLFVIAIVSIITVVNKRKANDMLRAQTELIALNNKELNKVNMVKDKFFSIISHDLKSPFQSLSGILQLMNMNALSDVEVNKLFKELKVKFDSTNNLLENLLEWARLQMQDTKFEPSDVELYSTIENELKVVKNSRSKDVLLKNSVERVSQAYADINMLKLVIRNLVSNAVKFTKNKGNVEVVSEDLGDFVCISVKDDGVGISEENQKKIFSEEGHISTLGTHLESGTGLGLTLCKEFIEMHGGKIWVESEEGKGSIFKFTLKKAS